MGAVLLSAGERAGRPASGGGPAAGGGGAAAASCPAAASSGGVERSVLPVLRLVPAGSRLFAAQKVDSSWGIYRARTEPVLLEFLNRKFSMMLIFLCFVIKNNVSRRVNTRVFLVLILIVSKNGS